MKIRWILFASILCVIWFSSANAQKDKNITYDIIRSGFNSPPHAAKPKVYWWCLNGHIDTTRAREEMQAMRNAGIGGFDLFEIGVYNAGNLVGTGPAFFSEESLKNIQFVIEEAGRNGLTVGLNVASSWNAGGSWIKPHHGAKSLYFSKTSINGNLSQGSIKLLFPEINFPKSSLVGNKGKPMISFLPNGKPEYYEEVAVLAIPAGIEKRSLDTSHIINVSEYFDSGKDLLNWKAPSGKWDIYRYICSNSGQQLVLPGPNSAGLTIDHFDSVAVRTHFMYLISRLQKTIGTFRNTALKSFYLASYEARGLVWTSTLPDIFNKLNGYNIAEFIPALVDQEAFNEETTNRVRSDFRKTLSELMINNLYKTAKLICNSYGLKINCEAGGPGYPLYNGSAEPLKALGVLDIPRGEFWVNHSMFYTDENGKDSIDLLRVVKEVAAASHIYKRGIVEEEAFTSFQHWQEGPIDLKPIGDRAFCEGMNRVVFHGFSHNPEGTGFPGIAYHAGTHVNDKQTWWQKVRPFIEYLSRVSFIFQQTDFVADVLYYYGDRIPNTAAPKNSGFSVGAGYDYEVVNTDILVNDLKCTNGKLELSNGARFHMLALATEKEINPLVLRKLNELAKQGAVIIGKKPEKVSRTKNRNVSDEELLNELWQERNGNSPFCPDKKGKIYNGYPPSEILKILGVPPDVDLNENPFSAVDYIHYRKSDLDFYFVRNISDEWISRQFNFRRNYGSPEIWDPISGHIVPVPIYRQNSQYTSIPLTLAPYASYFVVFRKQIGDNHYTGVSGIGNNPPLMEFLKSGIHFMDEGTYRLTTGSVSEEFDNKKDVRLVKGPWKLFFSKGWGAPDSVVYHELASWSVDKNPGIRYYSGTGKYVATFQYAPSSSDRHVFLDLGELSKVAEVWLNEQPLGITWTRPFRYDITRVVKKGENKLTIEVANVWSNRLTGDAVTGEKYTSTNINISSKDIPWADTPLVPSGLFGPVTIKTVTCVKLQ